MKKTTFSLKNNLRLAFLAGMFITASCMLTACGETTEETTTTDTVTATEPVIETAPLTDTVVTDSGRAVIDPEKPE